MKGSKRCLAPLPNNSPSPLKPRKERGTGGEVEKMKNVDYAFFLTAFFATIGALIVTAVNEASFNISLVLLTFALVLITCVYAMRTVDIAKANRGMAEEMREQRLSEARPYLLLRLNSEAVQWDKDEKGKLPPSEFDITIRNVGKGPAINLWAARWSHENSFFGDSKGYLAPNEEWVTGISKAPTLGIELGFEKGIWLPELREVIENKYPGIVAVKYNDIHHRAWASYLCLERHVDVEWFVMEEYQNIVELKK